MWRLPVRLVGAASLVLLSLVSLPAASALQWKDCGNSSTKWIQFHSLEVDPQPLVLPGNISLTLTGKTTHAVSGTLALDVLIEEKLQSGFVEIPCRKGYGSCRFEDICKSLRMLRLMGQCPDVMTKNGIVCACPGLDEHIRIMKNVIEVPEVTSAWKWMKFPSDRKNEFRARLRLEGAGGMVRGCLEATLHVQA